MKVSESSESIATQALNGYMIDKERGNEVVALVRRRAFLPDGVCTGTEVSRCRVDVEGNVSNDDGPLALDELLVVADSDDALVRLVRLDASALLSECEGRIERIDDAVRIGRLAEFLRDWM